MRLLLDDVVDIPEDPAEDLLGQRPALQTLKRAVTAKGFAPACVALYGSWGAGKTNLMRSAYRELKDEHHVVWFDPWLYERSDDVLGMLLLTMIRSIPGKDLEQELLTHVSFLVRSATAVLSKVVPTLVGAAVGGPLGTALGAFAKLDPTELAARLRVESVQDDIQKLRKDFAVFVEKVTKGREGKRLIVFLDDLDRCLPDKAIWLIEAVKLFLVQGAAEPVEGRAKAPVVFVFGLDRLIIGEAVRARFPESTLYTGENYLEKIFDLSLEAPRARQANGFVKKLATADANVSRLSDALGFSVDGAVVEVLGHPVFANPRVIKRTMNRLVLWAAREETDPEPLDGELEPTQVVAWLAGAERFRSFRHTFVGASAEERRSLAQAVSNAIRPSKDAPRTELPDPMERLLHSPGFSSFFSEKALLCLLGPSKTPDYLGKQKYRQVEEGFRRLDERLRKLGL